MAWLESAKVRLMSCAILDVHFSEDKEILGYVKYCRFTQFYEVYMVIEDIQILLLVWNISVFKPASKPCKIPVQQPTGIWSNSLRIFSAYIVDYIIID